jgi:hypothetical protein
LPGREDLTMNAADMEVRVGTAPIRWERSLWLDGVDQSYESSAATEDIRLLEGEPDDERRSIVPGLVRVIVLSEDSEGRRALVQLPREVVMGGRRVWVPLDKLRR